MLVTANVFQPLIDVFESVLKFFHSGGISWGFSIILLTVAVRAVLVPLTLRQIKSMVRMQGLSPQMKEIQQKYKQDKQRQQQEMMKFYKENNVNPLASCLPLVLQLPVLISLYYMLKTSLRNDICPGVQAAYQKTYAAAHHISAVAAHGQTTSCKNAPGASFLFVHDLTAKATGVTLIVLLILYIGSQVSSSVLMSTASMDPTQRKVMMFLPLIFAAFVFRFPAGVLVYWITTNLWTIGQQYVVKKRIGPSLGVVAGAGAGSSGSGGATLTDGGGGSGGGGGGLGGMLRDRLRAAQDGSAGNAEAKNVGARSGAAATAKPAPRETRPSNGSGSGAGGGGGGAGGGGSKPERSSRAATKTTGSNGSRSKAKSSGNGTNGTNGSGNGSGSAAGGPPPRPPRKRKKRSGRRR